jgi:pimeloyl-ACP methyl ester carboxylesterase
LTRARIIFVPGLKPKPPPELYRQQLLRVMLAGLQRANPATAAVLADRPQALVVVSWTYLFYGEHRDITLDLEGIERLLTQHEPTPEDLRELAAWRRRLQRAAHIVGDTLPVLGRRLARPATRLLMHDASRYLKNRDGIGEAIRARVRDALETAWRDGDRVLLIGHSLGSVIAYETLWELSQARAAGEVELFVTLGSPLATRFIQRSLRGADALGVDRFPHNIRRWANFSAKADTTALLPRLRPYFREMIDLDLTETIEDHVGLENYFRGSVGLNAHEAYGYLAHRAVGAVIADWLSPPPR